MPSANQTRLDLYLAAEAKILAGQSFQYGDRRLQRADLSEVRRQINLLQVAVAREQSGGSRFSQANFGGCSGGDSDYYDSGFGRG